MNFHSSMQTKNLNKLKNCLIMKNVTTAKVKFAKSKASIVKAQIVKDIL